MTQLGSDRPITVGVADKQHAALTFAAVEARLHGCDVRVVHAFMVPPSPPQVVGNAYGFDIDASFRESGREVLAGAVDFLADQHADVSVRGVLELGPTPTVLTAASQTSRLLVLGPDDTTPWYSRLFRGRVSRALAHASQCPVVVVPDTWDAAEAAGGVTLLLDHRTAAHGPLRYAFDHASRHHEAVRIVHVRDDDAREETRTLDMHDLIDSWCALYPDVRADVSVIAGVPDLSTVESLETTGLLVLGRPHDHHTIDTLDRSLARAVIKHAGCPVAVVPAGHDG